MQDENHEPVYLPIIKSDKTPEERRREFNEMLEFGGGLEMLREVMDFARKTIAEDMARDIAAVQPIDPAPIANLMASSKSEEELRAEGYEPVCDSTRLLWTKKAGTESK